VIEAKGLIEPRRLPHLELKEFGEALEEPRLLDIVQVVVLYQDGEDIWSCRVMDKQGDLFVVRRLKAPAVEFWAAARNMRRS
jgi:hypothetical protein